MKAVELKGVSKKFGEINALDNFTLEIEEGEIMGIIGPNGAGKTTTIRIISGILRPDDGEVRVYGYDVTKNPLEVKKLIGYLPEEPNLYERFTVYELLKYFGELYDVDKKKLEMRIKKLLKLVNMEDRANHRINTLSKGMRQRVAVARALIHDPKIVIFDEPTMGLDPGTALTIRKFIAKLRGKKTVILCTHYMEEAEMLCDRVAILNKGKILDIGTPEELKSKIHSPIVLQVKLNDLNVLRNLEIQGIKKIEVKKHHNVEIFLEKRSVIPKIVEKLGKNILSINTKETSLQDVFIKMVGEDEFH